MHAFFVQLAIMKRKEPWRALFAASVVTALALAGAARAAEEEKLPDKFGLRLAVCTETSEKNYQLGTQLYQNHM